MGKEEKQLYKILAQREGVTIRAATSKEVTMDEAKEIAVKSVFGGIEKVIGLEPIIVLPITTEERWKEGAINYCPRCGANITDYEMDQYADFTCFECDTTMEIQIYEVEDGEE